MGNNVNGLSVFSDLSLSPPNARSSAITDACIRALLFIQACMSHRHNNRQRLCDLGVARYRHFLQITVIIIIII